MGQIVKPWVALQCDIYGRKERYLFGWLFLVTLDAEFQKQSTFYNLQRIVYIDNNGSECTESRGVNLH